MRRSWDVVSDLCPNVVNRIGSLQHPDLSSIALRTPKVCRHSHSQAAFSVFGLGYRRDRSSINLVMSESALETKV